MSSNGGINDHIKKHQSKQKSSGQGKWLTTVYSQGAGICNWSHHLYKSTLLEFFSFSLSCYAYKHWKGMHQSLSLVLCQAWRALDLVLRLYHQQKTLSSLDSGLVFIFLCLTYMYWADLQERWQTVRNSNNTSPFPFKDSQWLRLCQTLGEHTRLGSPCNSTLHHLFTCSQLHLSYLSQQTSSWRFPQLN